MFDEFFVPEMRSERTPANGNIVSKILGFQFLPKGWHYGEGKSADPEAVEKAVDQLSKLANRGVVDADAFPGVNGEIEIVFYLQPNAVLEMILEMDGTWTTIFEENGTPILSANRLTDQKLAIFVGITLHNLEAKKWASSGLFTLTTITIDSVASRVQRSEYPATAPVHQSSVKIAQSRPAHPFVLMHESFTKTWAANRRFSGGSIVPRSTQRSAA